MKGGSGELGAPDKKCEFKKKYITKNYEKIFIQ